MVEEGKESTGESRVRMTGFDPRVHGFAFPNSWQFPKVLPPLLRRVSSYRQGGGLYRALTYSIFESYYGPREGRPAQDLPPYGLCGGMCYVALDFFHTPALQLPRGGHRDDRPVPGTRLHGEIWKRQLDSLIADGVRFLAWVRKVGRPGGAAWLLDRSWKEWHKLKAMLDAGEPAPIGLVRETRNVFEDHQVLAIGYEERGERDGTILLYDPNCPDQVSAAELNFGEHELTGRESCADKIPLRGFFCERYRPRYPAAVVGRDSRQATGVES